MRCEFSYRQGNLVDLNLILQSSLGFTGITPENEHRVFEAKVREDPLFAIKLKEKRMLEEILENPLKMKHIKKSKHVSKKHREPQAAESPSDWKEKPIGTPVEYFKFKVRSDSSSSRPELPQDLGSLVHPSRRNPNERGRSPPRIYNRHARSVEDTIDRKDDDYYTKNASNTEDDRRHRLSRSGNDSYRNSSANHLKNQSPPVEQRSSTTSQPAMDPMKRLEAMTSNAAELALQRAHRLAQDAREQESERHHNTPVYASNGQSHFSSAVYQFDNDKIGSSMSTSSLHDSVRRKTHFIQKNGGEMFDR